MRTIVTMAVMGVLFWAATGRAAEKTVAYLGVTTASVEEALGAQLKLPPGVGLLVEFVDEKSPAAGTLQKNDVLHKLDDQILVNPPQLQALLRAHQPGDTVTLTVIRGGESKKITVKLGERPEAMTPGLVTISQSMAGVPDEIARAIQLVVGTAGSNVVKVLPQISVMVSSNLSGAIAAAVSGSGCGIATNIVIATNMVTQVKSGATVSTSVTVNESATTTRVYVKNNERGTFTLTCTDGQKHFTAVGKDGQTLFNGPINTDEERARLSDELKTELQEMEKTATLSDPTPKARSKTK